MTDPRPDVEGIERRANAATEGPWTSERQDDDDGGFYYAIHGHLYDWVVNVEENSNLGQTRANAAFISAARSDIPSLIKYIRELEARLSVSDEMVERACLVAAAFDSAGYADPDEAYRAEMRSALLAALGGGK